MGGTTTVAALVALKRGAKVPMGHGLYARKNADGSVSFTLRMKREGRSVDITIGSDQPSKAAISDARLNAEKRRQEAKQPARRMHSASTSRVVLPKGATLKAVWEDYLAEVTISKRWTERNRAGNVHRIDKHVATWKMWERPIASITAAEIAGELSPLRATVPAQCRKLAGLLSLTFTHGTGHGQMTESPMPLAVKLLSNTAKATRQRHHHALTKWKPLRALYRAIENMTGEASVRNALRLQALTAQRTGEVIEARWSEFDLDAGTWTIPRTRMKVKDRPFDHVVHLPTQAVQWLSTLPRKGDHLFPGRMGAPTITSESASKAMRVTLGMRGTHVPHGWRAAVKTLATGAIGDDGRPLFAAAWVEAVLDHLSGSQIEDAYQRGELFEQAGKVLQWWADQLMSPA